ncbi:MAG: LytR/AlgR family response regulator transcription factor, partial [Rhodococcus sp. (in: high G+C Gram-positive bacteria)]
DVRGESRGVRRLAIRSRERTVFVSVADVDFVEAAGNYVRVHTGGESHLMRETLGQIEAKLDSERFARIHRSTIVNVERISEMHPMFNGDQVIVLRDGRRLTVSRTFREDLLALLERA